MKTVLLIFSFVAAGLLKRSYESIEPLSPDPVYISCTACPKEIRSFLNIPVDADCDQIKWKLQLNDDGKYTLNTLWGFYVTNSKWEERGKLTDAHGKWTVSKTNPGFKKSEIYSLASDERPGESLLLLRLNDNMMQIMSKDKKMIPGSEGFANTLNRNFQVDDKSIDFTLESVDVKPMDMTLAGRTPYKPFDKELSITDNEDHDKIKWKFVLYADGKLEARRILGNAADYKGKWTTSTGWSGNQDATVYRLDFETPEKHTLYLLKGTDDLFFFLSKDGGMINGNHQFGSSLIRRTPSGQ